MTKILIVEDEVLAAMSMSMVLRRLGYKVLDPAPNAEEAVKSIAANHPDVILMDVSLVGETDGIDLARQIHAQFGTPIVFITGYVDHDIQEQAMKIDPIGYFVKPVDFKKVQHTIDTWLEQHP
jgi:CheY-like chemotaxis protein